MDKYTKSEKSTVLISSNYAWTIYNFRMSLIRRLKSEGYKVIVVTQFDGYEAKIALEVDLIVPLFISRHGVNPFVDFLTIIDFVRYFLKFKPDIFLAFSVKPVIYGSIAAKFFSISSIIMITGLGTAFITNNWVTGVVKKLYKFALSTVSIVFFQNDDDRDIFIREKLVNEKLCRYTPGSGVDVDKFVYSTLPDTREISFLLIARMLWDKGIGEFVEAAKTIKHKYTNAKFQLLGPLGVQNRTSIKAHVVDSWQHEGLIEYLGEADDVSKFIARASCIVLPSYREGTSRVLLEAAAMGRPLIATDVPGCREVVEDGVTGFLCKPRDHADLSQKIELMLNLPYESRQLMGVRGRRKIEGEFREEIVCDLYINAIESCSSV